jgi:hypothetical protein
VHLTVLWPLLSLPMALSFLVAIGMLLWNIYRKPLPYIIFLFLPFLFATVTSWSHVVSQVEAAMIAYSATLSFQRPRRFNVARITNWTVVIYVVVQVGVQLVLLALQTHQLVKMLGATDTVSQRLQTWSADWVEGSGLPLAQLLTLQPLLTSASSAFDTFLALDLAYASFLLLHLYLMFLLLIPATLYQVRDLRRQLLDLRRTRQGFSSASSSSPRDKRTPLRKLVSALFVRSDPQTTSSRNRDTSRERLLLLESIVRNVCVRFRGGSDRPDAPTSIIVNLFFLFGNIAVQPFTGYTIKLLVNSQVRDKATLIVQVGMMCALARQFSFGLTQRQLHRHGHVPDDGRHSLPARTHDGQDGGRVVHRLRAEHVWLACEPAERDPRPFHRLAYGTFQLVRYWQQARRIRQREGGGPLMAGRVLCPWFIGNCLRV